MNTYKTVRGFAFDELVEKRSRFIGYCKPVKTQDEAIAFINEIKSKHWDARHNVYAYVIRDEGISRYSDDNEPQGTAGIPVLDSIRKRGITDCVVVVTRYFGGVLLGAGGLVRAYSAAAKLGIDAAGEMEMEIGMGLHGEPGVMRCGMMSARDTARQMLELILLDCNYENSEVVVLINGLGGFNKALSEESSGKYAAVEINKEFFEKS